MKESTINTANIINAIKITKKKVKIDANTYMHYHRWDNRNRVYKVMLEDLDFQFAYSFIFDAYLVFFTDIKVLKRVMKVAVRNGFKHTASRIHVSIDRIRDGADRTSDIESFVEYIKFLNSYTDTLAPSSMVEVSDKRTKKFEQVVLFFDYESEMERGR